MIDTPSPNHGDRIGGDAPDLVILHYTAMESCKAALDRLCDPQHEVSAHYLLGRDGTLHKLVPEDRRAWHAGASFWRGETDINSRSIGIELDYPGSLDGFPPFAAAQMDALDALLRDVAQRHTIAPHNVLGHSDIAPSRKADPGPKFDWSRLARAGLAQPKPQRLPEFSQKEPDPKMLAKNFASIGYDPHASFEDVLAAFRLRWRAGHAGPPDKVDAGLAHALAQLT